MASVLKDGAETEADPSLPAPIVTTPRLIIRPYHPSDALPSQAAADTPGIARYMSSTFPYPYTLAAAQSWIATATTPVPLPFPDPAAAGPAAAPRQVLLHFALTTRDGAFAGGIGLKPRGGAEAHTAEVGYWLAEARWGAGLATEAAAAFARWAFAEFPGLERLEARVFGGNVASERVLAKAGFAREGTRRRAGWKEGLGFFGISTWGLLRGDLAAAADAAAPGGA